MAILQQCPICKTRQPVANKKCRCGINLDKAKKSGQVRYWITYYLPGNKMKWELSGESLDDAKNLEADRRLLKKSGKLPESMRGSKLTFKGLTDWYLKLESVKALASADIIKLKLDKFNAEFGSWTVNSITASDLKNFQAKLQNQQVNGDDGE